jgi:plasmid stability protein
MATLQVRSIDEQLYQALGRRATQDNRSISQEVIAILKEHLARPAQPKKATEHFLELCGTWKDERSPEEIAAEIRQNRLTKTRFKETM